ncbi:MAG: VOC family protein [Acidobacteriota bacterium]
MDDTSIIDLKAFVPAKDPALARQFYSDLGFKQNWANEQIAEFQIGAYRFLLQNYYVKEYAENYMMHLTVENADVWWQHIQEAKLGEKYPDASFKPPALQPWGLRVLFIVDPTGVLWHIAERPSA